MTKYFLLLLFFFVQTLSAATLSTYPQMDFDVSTLEGRLLNAFKNAKEERELDEIKQMAVQSGGQSISALLRVMKDSRFPDQSRWTATFLLAQIAGERSAPVLSRFLDHPNWMMRLAGLKALLALGVKDYASKYAEMLEDQSLLVRAQALDNIRYLKLTDYAPQVWSMLYNRENYDQIEGDFRRGDIIRSVILTIGDLDFKDAKKPLFQMIQQDRYNDIFLEMDHALQRITGRQSPGDNEKHIKRRFWQRVSLSLANI